MRHRDCQRPGPLRKLHAPKTFMRAKTMRQSRYLLHADQQRPARAAAAAAQRPYASPTCRSGQATARRVVASAQPIMMPMIRTLSAADPNACHRPGGTVCLIDHADFHRMVGTRCRSRQPTANDQPMALACADQVCELRLYRVGESDDGWPVVPGAVVAGFLEGVVAGAPAFDDAGRSGRGGGS